MNQISLYKFRKCRDGALSVQSPRMNDEVPDLQTGHIIQPLTPKYFDGNRDKKSEGCDQGRVATNSYMQITLQEHKIFIDM